MSHESAQTVTRQWEMLRAIPRAPSKVTVAELVIRLNEYGFSMSRRTIERDLHTLSAQFPLVLDDRNKPFGWSWARDANFEFMPGLTLSQAVPLLLAKTHLQRLLPRNMQNDLVPIFDAAERTVASSGWKNWHKRTAVLPTSLALLPPTISAPVMTSLETALARNHCIDGRYRGKGSREAKWMRIHPLGLILRGAVMYLVCTLFDYDDVRQLALHRLIDVAETGERRQEPEGFDFNAYVRNEGATFHRGGPIRLVALFDEAAAEHLHETPLSKDQMCCEPDGSGRVKITATVEDDMQLRWWLMAFGGQVEVVEPTHLGEEIYQEALQIVSRREA